MDTLSTTTLTASTTASTTLVLPEAVASFLNVPESGITLSSVTFDATIVVGLIALFLLYALARGKSRSTALFLSLYPAALLTGLFPHMDALLPYVGGVLYAQITVFIALTILMRVALARIVYSFYADGLPAMIFQAFLISVCIVGGILFIGHQIIPLGEIHAFSEPFHRFFSSQTAFFWTTVVSLALLYPLNRRV